MKQEENDNINTPCLLYLENKTRTPGGAVLLHLPQTFAPEVVYISRCIISTARPREHVESTVSAGRVVNMLCAVVYVALPTKFPATETELS